jgi:hypothetical protein
MRVGIVEERNRLEWGTAVVVVGCVVVVAEWLLGMRHGTLVVHGLTSRSLC